MLELLVSARCPMNSQNIMSDAPLHVAAINGHGLAAGYLVGAGADVNVRNEFNKTLCDTVEGSGRLEPEASNTLVCPSGRISGSRGANPTTLRDLRRWDQTSHKFKGK